MTWAQVRARLHGLPFYGTALAREVHGPQLGEWSPTHELLALNAELTVQVMQGKEDKPFRVPRPYDGKNLPTAASGEPAEPDRPRMVSGSELAKRLGKRHARYVPRKTENSEG